MSWLLKAFALDHLPLTLDPSWGITDTGSGYRFWPDKVKGEGFFIACFHNRTEEDEVAVTGRSKPSVPVKAELELLGKWVKKDGMTFVKHELNQGMKTFWIWTSSIAFMVAICVFMFPEMTGEMDSMTQMFSSMGSLTTAFGMDQINFGSLIGFYAIEAGSIIGLGGAFYTALISVGVLAKEEKDRTSEFLLSHPVTRVQVISENLVATVAQVLARNVVVFLISIGSIAVIGETIPWKEISLLHLAFVLMQIEIAGICFGISAFIKRGSLGIGLGIAILMYFLNLVANIAEGSKFLKFFSAFSMSEGADIVSSGKLEMKYVFVGMTDAIIGIITGYIKYSRKDIS